MEYTYSKIILFIALVSQYTFIVDLCIKYLNLKRITVNVLNPYASRLGHQEIFFQPSLNWPLIIIVHIVKEHFFVIIIIITCLRPCFVKLNTPLHLMGSLRLFFLDIPEGIFKILNHAHMHPHSLFLIFQRSITDPTADLWVIFFVPVSLFHYL